MENQDFIMKEEDIEVYGDDVTALIRAFADRIASIVSLENQTDKDNLEYLKNEIEHILKYEL